MTDFKGTPGPWVLNYDKVSVAIPHRGPSCVTHTYAGTEANARLIAEAPTLLEMLDRQSDSMAFILNHITIAPGWYDKFIAELAEARAAIAKALGQ